MVHLSTVNPFLNDVMEMISGALVVGGDIIDLTPKEKGLLVWADRKLLTKMTKFTDVEAVQVGLVETSVE